MLFCLTLPIHFAIGQSSEKYRDISITTSSFNNFGLMYRVGKENNMWRFQTVFIDADYSVSHALEIDPDFQSEFTNYLTSYSMGLSAGKEWRKPLAERFNLRLGVDIYATYSFENEERYTPDKDSATAKFQTKNNSLSLGPRAVFGFDYSFSKSFLVGINLSPYLYYRWNSIKTTSEVYDSPESNNERNNTTKGVEWNLANSLLLSISYQL